MKTSLSRQSSGYQQFLTHDSASNVPAHHIGRLYCRQSPAARGSGNRFPPRAFNIQGSGDQEHADHTGFSGRSQPFRARRDRAECRRYPAVPE